MLFAMSKTQIGRAFIGSAGIRVHGIVVNLPVQRWMSSSSNSSNSTGAKSSVDWNGLTPIDIEKELFKIKRRMGGYYSKGMYHDALICAVELEQHVSEVMGTKNAVYASCLNNVALMNKMLGNTDIAMNKYTEALQTYEDIVGKTHPSYVSTLANLGVLYKALAEAASGMERLQLIERADESLTDAYKLRQDTSGSVVHMTITPQQLSCLFGIMNDPIVYISYTIVSHSTSQVWTAKTPSHRPTSCPLCGGWWDAQGRQRRSLERLWRRPAKCTVTCEYPITSSIPP